MQSEVVSPFFITPVLIQHQPCRFESEKVAIVPVFIFSPYGSPSYVTIKMNLPISTQKNVPLFPPLRLYSLSAQLLPGEQMPPRSRGDFSHLSSLSLLPSVAASAPLHLFSLSFSSSISV